MLTVTGAAIDSSVIISGLTFRGGVAFGLGCPEGCGGALLITGTASPLLHSLLITNNVAWNQGGGLYASAGSVLRLTSVNVVSNTSISNGGGIYASRPVIVTGGLYQNNRCVGPSCGAAALLAVGTMNISGTRFISNTSQGSAGAVYAPQSADFTGGLFQDNRCVEAACFGGALYANNRLVVTGTQFLSNTSTYHGGALFANQPATLTGSLFRHNRCTQAGCVGGGIYSLSSLALTNTSFISNSSLAGGGAALASGTLLAHDGLVQDNRCTAANCEGGGLYASFGLNLASMQILSNTALGDGGGAYTDGPVVSTGGQFLNNRCAGADCVGGALRALSGLLLTQAAVISNSSGSHGAGIYANGPVTISASLFSRNACTQPGCGAAALLAAGPLSITGAQFISNTSLGSAGAVYAPFATRIAGSLFQENRCTEDTCFAGALYANSSLILTSTQFLSNTSRYHGGALFANQPATLTNVIVRNNRCTQAGCAGGGVNGLNTLAFTGGEIFSNTSQTSGGGLLASLGLALTGTSVISNSAPDDGGGAYANGPITLRSALFQDNRCTLSTCRGAGLFGGYSLLITDTLFVGNLSRFDGGGLYALGPLTLIGGLFDDNHCQQAFCHGGGLVAEADLAITATAFTGNSSLSHGGGLFAHAALTVTSAQFVGNQSALGGGLNHSGASALIVNTLFAGNTATSGDGAALSALAAGNVSLVHNTIASGTLGSGSAVFVQVATVRLTNTLLSNYAIGLERSSGALAEDYTLFATVTQPYLGSVGAGPNSFTGTAGFANPALGDFHLGPLSDARDAALPVGVALDFEGDPRPVGPAPDIGFDEYLTRLFLPLILR